MHVSRAMQAARRRSGFDFTRRLGRRAEAGPRQVLRRVSPRRKFKKEHIRQMRCSCGSQRNMLKHVQHAFVLLMWADPEPNDLIAIRQDSNRSITPADPRRHKPFGAVYSLEVEARMTRIASE